MERCVLTIQPAAVLMIVLLTNLVLPQPQGSISTAHRITLVLLRVRVKSPRSHALKRRSLASGEKRVRRLMGVFAVRRPMLIVPVTPFTETV